MPLFTVQSQTEHILSAMARVHARSRQRAGRIFIWAKRCGFDLRQISCGETGSADGTLRICELGQRARCHGECWQTVRLHISCKNSCKRVANWKLKGAVELLMSLELKKVGMSAESCEIKAVACLIERAVELPQFE